jgi:hydrogenase maturation factor
MVNVNDVVTTGAVPKWFTVTVLLPEGRTFEALVESIFEQIHRACEKLNISLIGGHTEITSGLDRPILVGQLIGEVCRENLLATAGAQPGDVILLSKGICIEGTAIIARERERDLLSRGVSKELIAKAGRFLFEPGIGVVEEARFALQNGHVTSMHDITEGGLADGLHEISVAAGVQIEIEKDRIPIYEESRIFCRTFGLNPLGVIGSGSLLITASQSESGKILASAHREGVPITRIGQIKGLGAPSVVMVSPEGSEAVPYFERDELVKLF